MSRVVVSILAAGRREYHRAARQAVLSVLERTPFDVVVSHDALPGLRLPRSTRVGTALLPTREPGSRAAPFLRKFEAVRACLAEHDAPVVLQLDADALFCAPTSEADVEEALGGSAMAAAEQTTIVRTGWTRRELRDHFLRHSLEWIAPGTPAPELEAFRFFNSGVVIGSREAWADLTGWAFREIERTGPAHAVGEHMIADQDYVQFYASCVRPGSFRTLSWEWNHCEHWDEGFPRAEARIAHFSNFTFGPGRRQWLRMWALRNSAALGGLLRPPLLRIARGELPGRPA